MTRYPSSKHLASWAGVCPGHNQSGGTRLRGKPRHGDPWLRGVLGEVAQAIAHTKNTYLKAHDQRLARRRGTYKATVAVAHSVLVSAYDILRD